VCGKGVLLFSGTLPNSVCFSAVLLFVALQPVALAAERQGWFQTATSTALALHMLFDSACIHVCVDLDSLPGAR